MAKEFKLGHYPIFKEWRRVLHPVRPQEDVILDGLNRLGYAVRARRLLEVLNGRVPKACVFGALKSLIAKGRVEKIDGRAMGLSSYKWSLYRAVSNG